MSNYDEIKKENEALRNALSFFNTSSEQELQSSFINHYAQAEGNGAEEDLGGETAEKRQDLQAPAGDPALEDTKVEDILAEPDEQEADVLEWDNFSIARSDEYANKLNQEQGLSIDDANEKSYYIKYKTPDELLAVQGRMFGINKDEGEGIKSIGGFGTQEEIGKDLEYMKQVWESGFPVDEKDNLLVTLDELSPALEAFQEKKEQQGLLQPEQKEVVNVEKPEGEEVKSDEQALQEALNKAEDKTPAPAAAPAKSPAAPKSRNKPTPTIPKPLGKVPASLMNARLKRESRLTLLKSYK